MYDVISSALNFLKVDPITIDNNIFRLHYKVTVFILVLFSMLVTQRQYFGDPIDCLTKNEIDIIDTLCWIQSTFTHPELPRKTKDKTPFGIRNPVPGYGNTSKRYHLYYQWVTLFLFMQALLFYIPWYLWKIFEGGRLKMLIEGLHLPVFDSESSREKRMFLVSFFKLNKNMQNSYAYKFYFCEVLNLINVIFQIFITDAFVGYEFTTYGTNVLNEALDPLLSRSDTLETVFPKVAKCTFRNVGPSGGDEIKDALCVLPLNVFNEKIYIVLWFWFIIVAVLTVLGLAYRVATLFQPVRRLILRAKVKMARTEDIDKVNKKCSIGDWFLLHQIAKNMDEIMFKSFLSELAAEL